MPSYQDIETRLRTVENKLDFVMKTFTVTKQYRSFLAPDQIVKETKTLLDVYREVTSMNAQVIPVSPDMPAEPTDMPTAEEEIKDGVVAE